MSQVKFQIGKNGMTPGILDSLLLAFKNNKQVRISMLKSSGRDRKSIEETALKISTDLNKSDKYAFRYKIIGFTIIMSRHPK